MNQFEFSYLLSVHGNTAIPRLKLQELSLKQQTTLNLATAYYIEVIARLCFPHPLICYHLSNIHDGWAGLCSDHYLYDYERYKNITAIGLLSNRL